MGGKPQRLPEGKLKLVAVRGAFDQFHAVAQLNRAVPLVEILDGTTSY
ncbi:hypothetical protein [Bradyrhizobium sp. Tv2a-2]|nr:hypothetical protein [Bradyrhizobium sp. Tv2a-2]